MSNVNQRSGNLNLDEDTQRQLAKLGAISYSIGNTEPVSAKWIFTPSMVVDIMTRITKEYINDMKEATIYVDRASGKISGYIWIPKNSKHLTNRDLADAADSAIRKNMSAYSSQLKEFMDKFCRKGEAKIIPPDKNNSIKGLEVELMRFFRVELDERGTGYAKLTSNNYSKQTKVTAQPKFLPPDKRVNRGPYDVLQYFNVWKSVSTDDFNRIEPRPRKSYNAR